MQTVRGWELKTVVAPSLLLALWQRCSGITRPVLTRRWRLRSRRIRTTLSAREMQQRLNRRAVLRGERFVGLDIFPVIATRSTKRLAN